MNLGRKVKSIREFVGMKQSALALELGTSQQYISKIEKEDYIDDKVLEKIAGALGVSISIIKNFNNNPQMLDPQLTFSESSGSNRFNPVEKIFDLYDELLKSEKEKTDLLEKMLAWNNKTNQPQQDK